MEGGMPVGIYNGLKYYGFSIATAGSDGIHEGVVTQSKPNMAIGVATKPSDLFGTHTIATNYTDSQYKTFDLNSFYFACNQDTFNSAVGVAVSCVITVIGYYPDGSQTPVYTAGSAAPYPARDTMVLAAPDLKGIDFAQFSIASSAWSTELTNVFVDDLVHVNYP